MNDAGIYTTVRGEIMVWWSRKCRVGFDPGGNQIKMVQLKEERGGWVVDVYGTAPTPAGAVVEGVIQQAEEVGVTLRELAQNLGIVERRLAAAIPGQQIQVRRMILQDNSRRETQRALVSYAANNLPFPLANSMYNLTPVNQLDYGSNCRSEYLLVAVQRMVADEIVKAVSLAGMVAEATEGEPVAYYRTFGRRINASSAMTLLNMGVSGTQVSFFINGQWCFHRYFPAGMNKKLKSALSSKTNLAVVAEVAQSWESCQGQLTSKPVPPLVLVGGGTRQPGVYQSLINNFTLMEQKRLIPGITLPPEAATPDSDWLSTYGAALGLAMRDIN